MSTSTKEEIHLIPGEDGWWHSDGEKAFQEAAKKLVEKGFTDEEAVEFLTDLFWVVSGEYGN